MTATLLRHRPRNPLGVAQTTIIIGLLLSPVFFKVFGNYAARAATINEYQTGRSFILSKVDAAVEKNDVSTLLHLHRKYAGCVTDTNFMGELKEALAKATARETEVELTISKHLDLTRHREESDSRNGIVQHIKNEAEGDSQSRLSRLPH